MLPYWRGTKIGWACHYVSAPNFGWTEIGYAIIQSERRKGYGTEAVQMLLDLLTKHENIFSS